MKSKFDICQMAAAAAIDARTSLYIELCTQSLLRCCCANRTVYVIRNEKENAVPGSSAFSTPFQRRMHRLHADAVDRFIRIHSIEWAVALLPGWLLRISNGLRLVTGQSGRNKSKNNLFLFRLSWYELTLISRTRFRAVSRLFVYGHVRGEICRLFASTKIWVWFKLASTTGPSQWHAQRPFFFGTPLPPQFFVRTNTMNHLACVNFNNKME